MKFAPSSVMRKILALLALLLAAVSAHAQQINTSPASFPFTALNVKTYGARGDTMARSDGAIATGTTAFTSSASTFTAADVGKVIAVSGAGAAGTVPLSTTIAAVVGAHAVTLTDAASSTVSGASFIYGTDDSAAWTAAINQANTLGAAGQNVCVYLPASVSLIVTAPPIFTRTGCLIGDGPHKSYIAISPSLSGDVFTWSDVWMASNYPQQGPSQVSISNDRAGPLVQGLSVVGNQTSPAAQNIFTFYDHTDFLTMRDVEMDYVNGRCLYLGPAKNDATSYTRESQFYNIRFVGCGNSSAPGMEITATGSGDSSNQLKFFGVEMFFPGGQALVIRNANTAKSIGNIRFYGLRAEGVLTPSPAINGDLITFGDGTLAGTVSNIEVYGFVGNASYTSYSTIMFTAPSAGAQPFNILVQGTITSGNGGGINVQAGRSLRFVMEDIATTGTAFTMGSNTLVGNNIDLDMNGREAGITYSIDTTTFKFLRSPLSTWGVPGNASTQAPSVLATVHDNTATGGNAVPPGSVDLQTSRNAATQVPSGTTSGVLGGSFNTASGALAIAIGGSTNLISGGDSVGLGGAQSLDRTRFGNVVYASGRLAANGDAQTSFSVLRGTGATASAFRLTSDNAAAGANNCFTIPNNAAYAITVTIVALDHTTVSNNESWNGWQMLLTRGANAASTALVSGATPTALTNGTVTGSAIAATADTTNGCLNISFTPPTGNTDTWNAVAKVESVEVQ